MSTGSTSIGLDLTPKGLFPKIKTAAKDPKCAVIADTIQQLAAKGKLRSTTQSTLQKDAANRYAYLSQESRIALPYADHAAFLLYQQGVAAQTAQKYYSFRLSAVDASQWKIVLV